MSNVQSLVIDELDTFLDSGNEDKIRDIIKSFLKTEERQKASKQIILSTATITGQMDGLIKDYFAGDKDFAKLIEKKTHMNLTNLKHEFI